MLLWQLLVVGLHGLVLFFAGKMSLTTLVIGASNNPDRYAYKAIKALLNHGHTVIAVGNREGAIDNIIISKNWPETNSIDTLTLYIGKVHQEAVIPKILALKPRRVIFNPGTENEVLETILRDAGIVVETACTLVLLATNQYQS